MGDVRKGQVESQAFHPYQREICPVLLYGVSGDNTEILDFAVSKQ
jgi:hypothetical protein